MKKVLLIDGDQYLFKGTAAVEKETRWDDQNHVLYANENEAWDNVTRMLRALFEAFGTTDHALTFSSTPGFRQTLVDPSYKAGRKDTRKPLCYALLREKIEAHYNCVVMAGLEADDVMGILSTKPGETQRIIVSADKDMQTVPGFLWRDGKLETITNAQADYYHLYQTLIGDTTDGYKGCPGMGPKKAEKLLDTKPDGPIDPEITQVQWWWDLIVSAFVKAGLTEADALTQARLARILRWSDWDSVKKEPILWTPS